MSEAKTNEIAERNDKLRSEVTQNWIFTDGIKKLPEKYRNELIEAIKNFNNFNADNDQFGLHDFGWIDIWGQRYHWKIDNQTLIVYDPFHH